MGSVTSPDAKQLQETPDAAAGTMVRACDRCGTVCSTDQEWCLNCGVRMTEPSQRLPGLRAAGLVVSLAVLLAGGAAAASYAALRGDARSTANVPAETTGTPVAQAPATTAPVTPTTTPAPTASVPDTTSTSDTSDLDTSGGDDTAADTSSSTDTGGTGDVTADTSSSSSTGTGTGTGSSTGGSGTGSTGSGSTDTKSDDTKTDDTKTDDTKDDDTAPVSGPVTFAAGQGSIYDPDGVVTDRGDEAKAIDGSTSTSWKVQLAADQTGGFGYVVDFDPATKLKSLNVVSGTKGAKVKILGTKRSALPPDALDNAWDTLAGPTTLGTGDNVLSLQAVSGATSKYRHVLVLVTDAPGTPAGVTIREIKATR
jgi:hypothetical protein